MGRGGATLERDCDTSSRGHMPCYAAPARCPSPRAVPTLVQPMQPQVMSQVHMYVCMYVCGALKQGSHACHGERLNGEGRGAQHLLQTLSPY